MYDTLILCGNSTNAIVTLGAVQYLIDKNQLNDIRNYVGTSSGALLSCLLCIGYQPIEIITQLCAEKAYKTVVNYNISNLLLFNKPIMNAEAMERFLERLIVDKVGYIPTMSSVQQLTSTNNTLTIAAYNLSDDHKEYLSRETHPDLLISEAVMMSCSFPFMFNPYKYNDKSYVDGGFFDNFPVIKGEELTRSKCLGIITMNPHKKYTDDFSKFDLVKKLFLIFVESESESKISNSKNCDILRLEAPLNFFNFESTNMDIIKLFDIGYDLGKNKFIIHNY